MEKTLREAVSKVRSSFKWLSGDNLISDREIASELRDTALLFIKQATDKRKLWNSPNIFTTIPCLPMEMVELSDCSNYGGLCKVSRSIVPLPKIAEGNNFGMLIRGIYSIDYPSKVSRKFIESDLDRYANSLNLGLKTNQIHFWIQDKYLYIGDPNIESIKVSAYFEDDIPEDLLPFPDYCGQLSNKISSCCPQPSTNSSVNDMSLCCTPNPLDDEFKCPGYLIKSVEDQVCQHFANTYGRSQEDTTTDGLDRGNVAPIKENKRTK